LGGPGRPAPRPPATVKGSSSLMPLTFREEFFYREDFVYLCDEFLSPGIKSSGS
jgi:hypothetical protein